MALKRSSDLFQEAAVESACPNFFFDFPGEPSDPVGEALGGAFGLGDPAIVKQLCCRKQIDMKM
jgi:hypothetical protein